MFPAMFCFQNKVQNAEQNNLEATNENYLSFPVGG